ncbi:uncharacterized protein STEHIDRAFT_128538 [Stereum hirsutum FP-91666 SS1]|uniref:uncharacterized protein n=1 Tax=Stereum hirsutum (strain FP-91666) TaxID=721885 RepID=UPI000440FE43|nr:uncharacterized protein STEHIDRAFT_128538 [Stereum hirsutum FP-91666 SS1]EIM89565.1 hypothetical protein STEHIDRAFT_128538 [Stereum hirsutum FP-91666 SS1]
MPTFPSNPVNSPRLHNTLRRNPLLFGIPFLVIIVGSSFALSSFTQTRYDLHDKKVTQVSKQQELGLEKDKKKFDIREEYYKLSAAQDDEWENKRIQRPKGLPEWGVPPTEPPNPPKP